MNYYYRPQKYKVKIAYTLERGDLFSIKSHMREKFYGSF